MKKRIALIGYGVIGKRVADAIARQDDMELAGVCDVISDWRIRTATSKGFEVYAATPEAQNQMKKASIPVAGDIAALLDKVDLAVDCTPKIIAAHNVKMYRERGIKFILQSGEKHETTGHSFSAENNLCSTVLAQPP